MSDFEGVKPYTQAELDQQAIWANEFDQWWEDEGQYQRAGGGQYERSFAWWAWLNREQSRQAEVDRLEEWNSNQAQSIKAYQEEGEDLKTLLQKLIDDEYTTLRPSMAYEIQKALRGTSDQHLTR
ncbi:hypothetical protein VH96_13920 [Acinetobacter indicus]|uniref:hypothetical protein n=1 Tax=Acinetobacter indicus TaxID=756892 RepID=UPI0005F87230|nr:hypothetical protein [Acinetobacter indicus]KJV39371.1 hypothetical protein VH96_13920 [Acinetobacter indicus]